MNKLHIDELTLHNYRKFKDKTFSLNSQMNVIAGKNGSGRTAILEAATVMLGAYLAAFKKYVPSRFVANISSTDAHISPVPYLDSELATPGGIPQFPCTVSCKTKWYFKNSDIIKSLPYKRTLVKDGSRTKFDGENPMKPYVLSWEAAIAQANNEDRNIILPIMLYLSSARLRNTNAGGYEIGGVYTRTEGYSRCLDAKHGIDLAINYLYTLRLVAAEERSGKALPAYDAILEALNTIMEEELKVGERVIFSTRFNKDLIAIQMEDKTVIPFAALSDGYRNVIKIVLDIATRMCILNPYLGGNALKETPGVVLIDELDLSLHPTWQKSIIHLLKSIFPKVQFICATHSPFIIQSLSDGELISLDGEVEGVDYEGEGIEDIAEEIMGVSMPQYSKKKEQMFIAAEKYYQAIDEASSTEDVEKLREKLVVLEAEYSDNPAYLALIRSKYKEKALDIKDETN